MKFLFGHDGRGIGAVDVHPAQSYIAVAEKGDSPNVYIYEHPSLRVFRILRKGTERSYSDVTFSADGNLLATVGGAPDFLLTVWDWRQERMVLRTKAFAQEVCVSPLPVTALRGGNTHARMGARTNGMSPSPPPPRHPLQRMFTCMCLM